MLLALDMNTRDRHPSSARRSRQSSERSDRGSMS